MEFQVFKSHRITFYPLCPLVSVLLFGSVNQFPSPTIHSLEILIAVNFMVQKQNRGARNVLWRLVETEQGIYACVITGMSWFHYTYDV